MTKKTFWDKITSRSFRQTFKTFVILLIIFALFVFVFIKFVYYVKENIHIVGKPRIKQNIIDEEKPRIEENRPIIRNITVT